MAGWTPEAIDKVIRDAWDLYEKVPRVRRTADVHAAGFAFGRLQLTLMQVDTGTVTEAGVMARDGVLRDIGLHLYVGGTATAQVSLGNGVVSIGPGNGCEFSYRQGPSFEETPPGAVWSVAVNHDALLTALQLGDTGFASTLSDMTLNSMLPPAMLFPNRAPTLSGDYVADQLVYYVAVVKFMKEAFVRQLTVCLQGGVRVLAERWSPPWYPAVDDTSGVFALGSAYQAFRNEGIDLSILRDLAVSQGEALAQHGLKAPSTVQAIITSYGY